jgi:CysZ protein
MPTPTVYAWRMPSRTSAPRRFIAGMGYLGRGVRLWGTNPRLMFIGVLPALIVGIVYSAAIVVLALNSSDIAAWITPFASDWQQSWRTSLRMLAAIALVGGVIVLAVFTFAAVTLAVGDPFYERIWRATEKSGGGEAPESSMPWWKAVLGGLRLFGLTAVTGIVIFACGFIPLVGQTVIPVVGAIVGGWFLALELTGYAFEARGHSLRQRRRMLGSSRAQTLGFGMLTYVLFLVPFAAVVIMPAAVAGATLLAKDVLAGTDSPAAAL